MADMQEAEQEAYFELVQQLLDCPQGEEHELLAARSKFVNEQLVETLWDVAKILIEHEGQAANSKVVKLMGFVHDLTRQLDLDLGQKDFNDQLELQLQFLLTVLQLVSDSNADPQVVYPLLNQHLELLNDEMLLVLRNWYATKFTKANDEIKQYIAGTIIDFSKLIQEFTSGSVAVNIDLSIGCYILSNQVFTRETSPEIWAIIQNNLSNAYSNRERGDKADNLELSIQYCNSALEVRTKEDFPVHWATTQHNLAHIYSRRINGDEADNLELSIQCSNSALEIRTKEDFPVQWARTQYNLANVYSDRVIGDKADNLELSIRCYNFSLDVHNKKDYPIQWAVTQNSLAEAYSDRVIGDKANNLDLSIALYNAALEIRTKEDFPLEWAAIQNSLADIYAERIKGDKADDIELSIQYYNSALDIYTKDGFPSKWAVIQNKIANAYSNRIKGNKSDNLELSIAYNFAALDVHSKDDFPIEWAAIQNSLANVYSDRINDDKNDNLELSISYHNAALEVRTKEDFPIQWGTTQNNLANSYNKRISGSTSDNLELSISYHNAALEIRTKEDFPIQWGTTQNNLGAAYLYRERGNKSDNLELSIQYFNSALEINTPQTFPIKCLGTAQNLGITHIVQGNWQKAIDAYEIAMQAAETSRIWSVDDTERQRVLQEALSVYENAIQCAVNLKDYRRAIEYTERFRSRQLVELMASKDLYGDAQVPVEIQAYLTEYQQLNEDIDNLRESGDRTMSAAKTSRDSQALRADNEKISSLADRKQILYDKIRTHDPVLAGQIAIAPISHSEIQKLITNAHIAILTCYSTKDHTHIFILKQNQEPELFTCTGQGWKKFQQWLILKWLIPYKQKDNSVWRDRMPLVLAEIADRLQLPQLIANHLSDIQELVLVPHLLLHQIPFAALPTGNSEELLGEKFIIRSIPSCQILKYCQDRSPILTSTQGIVEDADDSLLGARYEGQTIAEIHGVREIDRLRGKSQATIANYRQLLSRVNRLHSSHHASSDLENPLESALSLADGKITLGDLLMGEKYPNLDEIFLSACETHLGKFTFTDDVATLTTGFLCIGARSVQSTLWSVDDLVTALFDIFYHQERGGGLDRARSLKAAQEKLCNLTGEEFKLYHYPKLIGYVTADSSARIDALKQQMKELHQQQSTLNNQTEEWQELAETMKSLTQKIKSIESIPVTLQGYCTMDRPFESPFYWAGFICQGMA